MRVNITKMPVFLFILRKFVILVIFEICDNMKVIEIKVQFQGRHNDEITAVCRSSDLNLQEFLENLQNFLEITDKNH